MRMREYARHSVTVTEPVLVNAYMKEKEYLCSLDMDKLLAGFRETAGLTKRADKYPGGWEDEEYSGHTLGHYMVALARIYAKEKSGDIKERLEYVLSELSQCQAENGYLFTYSAEVFDKLESGQPYKSWYTMHKIVKGLIAVYMLTGMEQAFTIVKKLGEWITDRVLNWTMKQKRWTLSVADGGMNSCLYELYKITGDTRYAEAAEKFDESDLFDPLAAGRDILANKHAADTIPKILGAINRYIAIGESEVRYLEVAQNFFDMVVSGHTYVTGGNGELMHFRTPGALAKDRTQYNSETCSTYGMMKLAETLYSVTGDKKYMDYYERAYFNAMLGAQNPEDGMTAFFQPMATGYFKTFSTPDTKFWCCTGTGMEMFTDLNGSIYHTGDAGIYVNLYVSSVLEEKETGVKLTQKVNMESFETAEFVLELKKDSETTLFFRLPEWSGDKAEVTVNGTAVSATAENGYISVECKDKDRIVLTFQPNLTMHAFPDMEYCVALTYGPLVLAAGLGQEDMTTERMRRTNVTVPTKNVAVMDRIVLQEGLDRSQWLQNYKESFVKKDGALAFAVQGLDGEAELVFSPYYKIYDERYGIYFECYDEENLPDDLRALKEEQKRLEEERLAAEAEAARLAEEERLRQEEEERKRQEAERMRREEARRLVEEEERKRQEEERKIREEEYRLRRGIELQRQELQRRLEAEAEERERREDEERKRRAEEERKRREEERRAAEAKKEEEEEELFEMSMEERFRLEQEEERRRKEESEAARRRAEEEAEAERQRKEEERKRREEDYRLRQGIDRQRQEMERRRQEDDGDRARRMTEEEERKRKEEARKAREEEYRLFKERELQRQELEKRRREEAEEAERKRKQEEEEAERQRKLAEEEERYQRRLKEEEERKRAEEERKRAEEERARAEEEKKRTAEDAKRAEEEKLIEAQRAAQLAEARLREEEAKLMLAKLAAERAEIEATMQKPEAESADKKKGLKGLFGGKKK